MYIMLIQCLICCLCCSPIILWLSILLIRLWLDAKHGIVFKISGFGFFCLDKCTLSIPGKFALEIDKLYFSFSIFERFAIGLNANGLHIEGVKNRSADGLKQKSENETESSEKSNRSASLHTYAKFLYQYARFFHINVQNVVVDGLIISKDDHSQCLLNSVISNVTISYGVSNSDIVNSRPLGKYNIVLDGVHFQILMRDSKNETELLHYTAQRNTFSIVSLNLCETKCLIMFSDQSLQIGEIFSASLNNFVLEINLQDERAIIDRHLALTLLLNFTSLEIRYDDILDKQKSRPASLNSSSTFIGKISLWHSKLKEFISSTKLNCTVGLENIKFEYTSDRFQSSESFSKLPIVCTLKQGKFTSSLDPDPLLKETSCDFFSNSFAFCVRSTVEAKHVITWKTFRFKLSYTTLTNFNIVYSLQNPFLELDYIRFILKQSLTLIRNRSQDDVPDSRITLSNSSSLDTSPAETPVKGGSSPKFVIEINATEAIVLYSQRQLTMTALDVHYDKSKLTFTFKESEIRTLFSQLDKCSGESSDISRAKYSRPEIDMVQADLKNPILEQYDVAHRIAYFSCFKMIFNYELNEKHFIFSDEIYFLWSITFHNLSKELIKSYRDLWNDLKSIKSNTAEAYSTGKNFESPLTKSETKAAASMIHLQLKGDINFGALLSKQGHTLLLRSTDFSFVRQSQDNFSIASKILSFIMDGHCIGHFDRVNVKSSLDFSDQLINRKDFMRHGMDAWESKSSSTISICVENIKIVFPYKYDFAESFNERFLNIIKMLKAQQSEVDVPHLSEQRSSKIPHDLHIKVNTLSMEVSDDPFEVKLRDNYELMEDEHRECIKREEIFRAKIEEWKRKNRSITRDHIEGLYAKFEAQQQNFYIDRHRKMYISSPPRTHLLLVTGEGLEFKFAANPSLIGPTRIIDYIIRNKLDEARFPVGQRFVTLWGRYIKATISTLTLELRDFQKPLLDIKRIRASGTLIGAEKESSARSKRKVLIDFSPEFVQVFERSMMQQKFYHDLELDVDTLAYTHGACWEPVLQQLNICFESIIRPSVDPSPSLPWWDKMRLLFHGLLRIKSKTLSLSFHGSLNPYNSTELIEVEFSNSILEYVAGKISVDGDIGLLVHTVSKYDDRRLLHLPRCKLTVYLVWECLGSDDHHSVAPHAADKVPDYSIHQNWDSYRAFRSRHLNVRISIENSSNTQSVPLLMLDISTLKWIQKQAFIFRGICRLTRRGKLFSNTKPRKVPFSRIFKEIGISIVLRPFKVHYWSSLSQQLGMEIRAAHLNHGAFYNLCFVPFEDGLSRRPRPSLNVGYINLGVSNVEVYLSGNDKWMDPLAEADNICMKSRRPAKTTQQDKISNGKFFLSLQEMSYNRASDDPQIDNDSVHHLVVLELKGVWTRESRDIMISLYDSFMKQEQLMRNLSNEALKAFGLNDTIYGSHDLSIGNSPAKVRYSGQSPSTSPATTMNKGHATSMLHRLIAESESNPDGVYTDDKVSEIPYEEPKLRGISACSDNDVIKKNWIIELVNSQVALRGCETSGYVIVSAARTEIVQKLHKPVWKDLTLFSKTTLVGSVDCMQYYATIDSRSLNENAQISWLPLENIEDRPITITEPADMVGSGVSAGGVVSQVVGHTDASTNVQQLQRITSRCSCQFYYANYSGDIEDKDVLGRAPKLPDDAEVLLVEPWEKEIAVDSFTLNHHDLEICTNSQQFAMIMDLVNNLLLYVESSRKETFERLERLRYQYILEDNEYKLRKDILEYQDFLRARAYHLKCAEREYHFIQRSIIAGEGEENDCNQYNHYHRRCELGRIEEKIEGLKKEIDDANDYLTSLIAVFKELQLIADKTRERQTAEKDGELGAPCVVRRIEICFKQGIWKLNDPDGQLGLAEVKLNNFIYTKVAKSDDSVEHSLELGDIKVTNCFAETERYKTVLEPTRLKPCIPVDRRRALRVYCREGSPQNGISVKEHFEVNVIPLDLNITHKFYKCMFSFFFDKDSESGATLVSVNTTGSLLENQTSHEHKSRSKNKCNSHSSQSHTHSGAFKQTSDDTGSLPSSGSMPSLSSSAHPTTVIVSHRHGKSGTLGSTKDDHIEKMRFRAQRNKPFAYIKITEVPLKLTFKGSKAIKVIKDFSFTLPTIEYHNQTWGWSDLVTAVKKESRSRLVSQALKHKARNFLPLTTSSGSDYNHASDQDDKDVAPEQFQEEFKAKLLLGDIAITGSHTNLGAIADRGSVSSLGTSSEKSGPSKALKRLALFSRK